MHLLAYDDDEKADSSSSITALSRRQGAKEIWWIGKYGFVQGAGDQNYKLAESGANRYSIAAVSRFPGCIDVMWISKDASIRGARRIEGRDWSHYEIVPPPPQPLPPLPPLPIGQQRIDASLEMIEGNTGIKSLKVIGTGFQANEQIKVFITIYVNNIKIRVDTLNTLSDTNSGSFTLAQEVLCNQPNTVFTVKAYGNTSGDSNSLSVSC